MKQNATGRPVLRLLANTLNSLFIFGDPAPVLPKMRKNKRGLLKISTGPLQTEHSEWKAGTGVFSSYISFQFFMLRRSARFMV